jgi:hypothetical protein
MVGPRIVDPAWLWNANENNIGKYLRTTPGLFPRVVEPILRILPAMARNSNEADAESRSTSGSQIFSESFSVYREKAL